MSGFGRVLRWIFTWVIGLTVLGVTAMLITEAASSHNFVWDGPHIGILIGIIVGSLVLIYSIICLIVDENLIWTLISGGEFFFVIGHLFLLIGKGIYYLFYWIIYVICLPVILLVRLIRNGSIKKESAPKKKKPKTKKEIEVARIEKQRHDREKRKGKFQRNLKRWEKWDKFLDFLKKIFLIDFIRSKIDKHKEKKAKSEKMFRDYEKEQDRNKRVRLGMNPDPTPEEIQQEREQRKKTQEVTRFFFKLDELFFSKQALFTLHDKKFNLNGRPDTFTASLRYYYRDADEGKNENSIKLYLSRQGENERIQETIRMLSALKEYCHENTINFEVTFSFIFRTYMKDHDEVVVVDMFNRFTLKYSYRSNNLAAIPNSRTSSHYKVKNFYSTPFYRGK